MAISIILCIWILLGFVSFTYLCEKGWENRHNTPFIYSYYLVLLVLHIIFGICSFFTTVFEIAANSPNK